MMMTTTMKLSAFYLIIVNCTTTIGTIGTLVPGTLVVTVPT